MANQQITISQDQILISGELTFATVASVLEASYKLFPQQAVWNCDFSQVSDCDSAGLALLLEWLKLAEQRKIKVRFLQVPKQLLSIATPAGLNQLLETTTR